MLNVGRPQSVLFSATITKDDFLLPKEKDLLKEYFVKDLNYNHPPKAQRRRRSVIDELFDALDGGRSRGSDDQVRIANARAKALIDEANQVLSQAKAKATAIVNEAEGYRARCIEQGNQFLDDARAQAVEFVEKAKATTAHIQADAEATRQSAEEYADGVKSDADRYAEQVLDKVYQARNGEDVGTPVEKAMETLQTGDDWSIINIID